MNKNRLQRGFEPNCMATTIGSLPHMDVDTGTRLMFESTPEIPCWVQFPKRSIHENMMRQFTERLPGLMADGDKIYFNTQAEAFTEELTHFYSFYLDVVENGNTDALDYFGISDKYASGFQEFIHQLPCQKVPPQALKGQVTGPFTLGMNLFDQDGRCSYYDDQLRDVIIKIVALKAMWQLSRLKRFNKKMIILIDEPALLSFGSQLCLSVSREDIINDLNEVADAIHSMGGLAGVHCEANTDWSILMETRLDILVFDAYDHLQGITLYPDQLSRFFDQGGILGWGIVPTLDKDAAANETLSSLLTRFDKGIDDLLQKGFDRELLLHRALITPSCGAGGILDVPLAERVLGLLNQVSKNLRRQYFSETSIEIKHDD
ncbi:MAG: hypothetical protein GY864_05545 [Desulfobacterales bacterium]|nr:hypothetical protein [Desulfobacterales bacterium]